MPLHFAEEELAARRRHTCEELARQGLDGLLIFKQESMYYLTGFDSYGYVFFQCLYLGVDGTLVLITRSPDLRQAQYTSVIKDIRIWVDAPDADPSRTDLRPLLAELGSGGKRLGIEWNAYGFTAKRSGSGCLNNFPRFISGFRAGCKVQSCPRRRASLATNDRRGGQLGAHHEIHLTRPAPWAAAQPGTSHPA